MEEDEDGFPVLQPLAEALAPPPLDDQEDDDDDDDDGDDDDDDDDDGDDDGDGEDNGWEDNGPLDNRASQEEGQPQDEEERKRDLEHRGIDEFQPVIDLLRQSVQPVASKRKLKDIYFAPMKGDRWVYGERAGLDWEAHMDAEEDRENPFRPGEPRDYEFCYLCDIKDNPTKPNQHRRLILDEFKQMLNERDKSLYQNVRSIYNDNLRKFVGQRWSLRMIREHNLEHNPNPLAMVARKMRLISNQVSVLEQNQLKVVKNKRTGEIKYRRPGLQTLRQNHNMILTYERATSEYLRLRAQYPADGFMPQ